MIIKRKDNFGFSFVEAIITVSVMLLVLSVLSLLYIKYSNFFYFGQTEIMIGESAREAAKQLQNSALQAAHIVSSHDFGGDVHATDSDTVVLQVPSIDDSGNVISGTYDYVAFYLTGSNFYKIVDADLSSNRSSGINRISDSVSAITFTYNNPDLAIANRIDMDLEMQSIAGGQESQYSLQQSVYLRNL